METAAGRNERLLSLAGSKEDLDHGTRRLKASEVLAFDRVRTRVIEGREQVKGGKEELHQRLSSKSSTGNRMKIGFVEGSERLLAVSLMQVSD